MRRRTDRTDEYLAAFYVRVSPTQTRVWCHNTTACYTAALLLGWRVTEEAWRNVWYNNVSRCCVCRRYINRKDGFPRGHSRRKAEE